jgi:quercetin dioxygenase-like cupin family protein
MTKRPILWILISMWFLAGSGTPSVGETKSPEESVQLVVLDKDVAWRPCPPHLPSGCEIAVLEGDPRSNEIFTVRFRLAGDFVMPPHTHPNDERVTVLQGSVSIAFGIGAKRESAKRFGTGDYYVNFRDAIHTVWSDEKDTVVQVTGVGPWEADFVDE